MNLFKTKINKLNKVRGLTMVETLVAISILTIAVIGPLGIIAQALHTSYYTRDQMTAYYLAQEPIEYVRNLRDKQGIIITSKYLNNPDDTTIPFWLANVVGSGDSGTPNFSIATGGLNAYSMIRTNGNYSFVPYYNNDSDYLKVTNGIFGDSSGGANATTSMFKREIYFQKTGLADSSSPQEFVMTVAVTWRSGSSNPRLVLKEYFTNWTSKTGL